MARLNASELAQRLGRQAEAVCRHYLSNGRKQGNYWQVGDVRNTAGRSMFVRLHDSVKGIAGKWQDYVAADVMLRRCSRAWLHQHSSVFTQHNLRGWRCA